MRLESTNPASPSRIEFSSPLIRAGERARITGGRRSASISRKCGWSAMSEIVDALNAQASLECGGDNLFGSGRVGGWHGHYEVQGASLEFDRLTNAGRRPFMAVLSAYCGRGVVRKKKKVPIGRARRRRGFVIFLLRSRFANDLNH